MPSCFENFCIFAKSLKISVIWAKKTAKNKEKLIAEIDSFSAQGLAREGTKSVNAEV